MSLAPSTRPARRVYRGAPRPLTPGACPHCGQLIKVTVNLRRRAHEFDGRLCTGSGVTVGTHPLDLDEAPIAIPVVECSHRACAVCGRTMRVRVDGRLKRHRPVADTFVGPHCQGGAS